MAWNEPGGGKKPRDPWGGGGGDQRPPDMDEVMRQLRARFSGFFGRKGGGGGGSGGSGGSGGAVGIILIALIFFYAVWAAFIVDAQERAVVLSFGEYSRTVGPGLNWHLPPFESKYKVNVDNARSYELREEMLTRDTNIVGVHLEVQYDVADPESFLLRTANPEKVLQHSAASALRQVVGASTMDEVLVERRGEIGTEVNRLLQAYLDRYNTGLNVIKTVLRGTAAPEAVRDAFDDVAKAKEDEDRFKNEAEAYANAIIPEARGRSQRLREEAEAYKEQLVARAEGDAERFSDLLAEYRKAPEVTRERLYIETMEQVLANVSKVLVGVEQGNSMIYLPLDRMIGERRATAPGMPVPGAAPAAEGATSGRSDSGYGSRSRELQR